MFVLLLYEYVYIYSIPVGISHQASHYGSLNSSQLDNIEACFSPPAMCIAP